MEGPEGFIPAVFGNAGSVIFDGDLDQPVILAQGDGHMRAMLEGVVDQIGQHAPQARPLDADHHTSRRFYSDTVALTRLGRGISGVLMSWLTPASISVRWVM